MKKSRKRNALVLALIVLLLATAVGYALFATNLTITGTVNAKGKWDIHFANATVSSSIAANSSNSTATLSSTGAHSINGTNLNDTLTVNVKLKAPGEVVTVGVDVVNGGTSDAVLNGFTVEALDGGNDEIPLEGGIYESGVIQMDIKDTTFTQGETLAASATEGGTTTKHYAMQFTWVDDESEEVDETATFTIHLNYGQATS